MPNRASRRPVTRVSSHRMRSTLRSTHNARKVTSPRLPIGVATRCRPGASSCSGAQAAGSDSTAAVAPGSDERENCATPGLLARRRWLGSPPAVAPLPEAVLAALAFPAVRLTDCGFHADRRAGRLHAGAHRTGAGRTLAIAVWAFTNPRAIGGSALRPPP